MGTSGRVILERIMFKLSDGCMDTIDWKDLAENRDLRVEIPCLVNILCVILRILDQGSRSRSDVSPTLPWPALLSNRESFFANPRPSPPVALVRVGSVVLLAHRRLRWREGRGRRQDVSPRRHPDRRRVRQGPGQAEELTQGPEPSHAPGLAVRGAPWRVLAFSHRLPTPILLHCRSPLG